MESKPVSKGGRDFERVSGVAYSVLRVPFRRFRELSASVTVGRRHSRMSVLLPEPLTPVTSTRRSSGNLTVRSRKLFFPACSRVSQRVFVSPFLCGDTFRLEPRAG